jgi:hypothetical protein
VLVAPGAGSTLTVSLDETQDAQYTVKRPLTHHATNYHQKNSSMNESDTPAPDSISRVQPQQSGVGALLSATLVLVSCIYSIGVTISIPYFNWCYARDNGFASWLFFGEIVATGQAVIWPVYAFSGDSESDWTDEDRENFKHFKRMSDAMQQSARIINSGPSGEFSVIESADARALVSLYAIALQEAELVDPALLAKAHPDLPAHFQTELLPFIQSVNAARVGVAEQMEAQMLLDDWVDWYNANRRVIRTPN